MPKLSHYDTRGKASMVDVTAKSVTYRMRDRACVCENVAAGAGGECAN